MSPEPALATVALAGVTYGLIEGPNLGWDGPVVVAMLAVGVAAAVAFVMVERSSPAPMLPLTMFRSRQFSVTNAVTFIVYAALGGALFSCRSSSRSRITIRRWNPAWRYCP